MRAKKRKKNRERKEETLTAMNDAMRVDTWSTYYGLHHRHHLPDLTELQASFSVQFLPSYLARLSLSLWDSLLLLAACSEKKTVRNENSLRKEKVRLSSNHNQTTRCMYTIMHHKRTVYTQRTNADYSSSLLYLGPFKSSSIQKSIYLSSLLSFRLFLPRSLFFLLLYVDITPDV